MGKDEIEAYLEANYYGVIKGQYDNYCPLKLNELSNFVNNVGVYSDLEIINEEGQEILFDTYGTFINRIWPELSMGDREVFRDDINAIASILQEEFRDNYSDKVLEKVQNFIDKNELNQSFKSIEMGGFGA